MTAMAPSDERGIKRRQRDEEHVAQRGECALGIGAPRRSAFAERLRSDANGHKQQPDQRGGRTDAGPEEVVNSASGGAS